MSVNISTFTLEGQDVDILFSKGKISYTFDIGSKKFGNAIQVKGRKTKDIIDAVFLLLVNFLETKDAAEKIK
jgi:hypothetical protein